MNTVGDFVDYLKPFFLFSSFLFFNSLVLKISHIVMVEHSDGLEDQS